MPLGGAKDKHFSCFHSSCQLGLSQENCTGFLSSCQRKLDKSIFLSRPPFALQYICTKLTENFINKTIFIYTFFFVFECAYLHLNSTRVKSPPNPKNENPIYRWCGRRDPTRDGCIKEF